MHENKCNLSAAEIRKPTASNAFINCNICSGDFYWIFFFLHCFFWHVQQVWEKINKSISFLKTYRINQSFTLGCKTEEGTQEPNKHWQVGQKLNIQMYWPRNSFWVQSKIRLHLSTDDFPKCCWSHFQRCEPTQTSIGSCQMQYICPEESLCKDGRSEQH